MCGIFGAIGNGNINGGIVRALAIVNRERGTDSLGFFDNSGKSVKSAADPLDCLAAPEFDAFINRAVRKGWFIAGHTRLATTGKVTDRNAHPFRFGNIIGAHNGMCAFPKDRPYTVDSEYLFDSLYRAGGDYQKALADIDGYWGLTWFDGASFYISTHDNSVAIAKADDGAIYYSSDSDHLTACVGSAATVRVLSAGATVRFDLNSPDPIELADFSSTCDYGFWGNYKSLTAGKGYSSGGFSSGGTYRYASGGATSSGSGGKRKRRTNKARAKADTAQPSGYDLSYANSLAREIGYWDWEDYADQNGANGFAECMDWMEWEALGRSVQSDAGEASALSESRWND